MNLWFCLWLAKRAWIGDRVELMVHEPYLEFRGPLRHKVMACVHRLMTMVLLGASRQVWMSIPAWEERLRPYALGRRVPMDWLPVPGCVASSSASGARALRRIYAADNQCLIGHFGSYGLGTEFTWLNIPGQWHGGANFSFADGHSSYRKWIEGSTLRVVGNPVTDPAPKHLDLIYLQSAVARKN